MANVYGREQILSELQDLLIKQDGFVKVICIEGEPGIGKTLIADMLCNRGDVKNHYDHIHSVSAYDSSWEQIVRALGNAIFASEHTKGTAEELQRKIVDETKGYQRYLICMDNIDDDKLRDNLRAFTGMWKDVSNSVLLLTGQEVSAYIGNNCCKCTRLEGLTERDDLKRLIGERLCTLLRDEEGVWDLIKRVTGGNPQKLLYLRWRAPKSRQELREFLESLEKDNSENQTDTAMEAIRKGLIDLKVPFEHFLSIANLRHPVFSGTVLASLWDRLGGGGSEYYERSLKHLLREGLLDIQKSEGVLKYRLNTTLHWRLQKAFNELVAPERQAQILFFLGDYFRARFAEKYLSFLKERKEYKGHDKKERFPIEDLDAYIKHTTDGGYVESAFRYLFSRGIIEWAHSAGSALGLMQILETLNAAIERMRRSSHLSLGEEMQYRLTRLSNDAKTIVDDICSRQSCALPGSIRYHLEGIRSSIQGPLDKGNARRSAIVELGAMSAVVHVALGRTYKDLNLHDDAIRHLEIAKKKLEDENLKNVIKDKLGALGTRRLKADLYHYMGIVYSVTGRPAECLEAYFEGVNYAADHGCFRSRDALSLGYLAYELKFYDINAALRMAKGSVDLAKWAKDDIVLSKNLCTQGQIESFLRRWEDANNSFNKAETKLDKKDDREACRIKVDRSVNHICKKDFDEAKKELGLVTESFGKTGDRRRIAIAKAYLGIIEFLDGNKEKGIEILAEAFNDHIKIGTNREAIYEAMTILWMRKITTFPSGEGHLKEDLKTVPEQPSPYDGILKFLTELAPEDLIYEKFWHRHYRPTLIVGAE